MINSDSDNEILFQTKRPTSSKHHTEIVKEYSSDDSSDSLPPTQNQSSNKIKGQLSSAEESADEMPHKKVTSVLGLDSNDSDDSDVKGPTEIDVFGSDSDEDEKRVEPINARNLVQASDESEPENNTTYQRTSYAPDAVGAAEEMDEQEETAVVDDGAIEVDFPVIKADLGEEMHLVKLPNFLSVETRPFDPMYYEDELDEDEVQDEEGRTRLKLKVENTIRWRFARDSENQPILDANDQPVRESNARMVRWSDGSLSLHLGKEIFDVHTMDISADHNHLFVREGSGLQAQAVFKSKLAFRPHSTDSFTHRKLTLSLADKSHKAAKVKLLPFAGENPDVKQQELIKREEEKMKANIRRENQRRKIREKASHKQMTASFLEQQKDDDHNPHAISLADIKKKTGRHSSASIKKKKSNQLSSTDDDDDVDDLSELSDPPPKKKVKKPRIMSDDESFSE